MSRKRIGIIGGGYAGLTAAYELQKQGYDVTVVEAEGDTVNLDYKAKP